MFATLFVLGSLVTGASASTTSECPTIVVVSPFGVSGHGIGRGFSRTYEFVDATEDSAEGRSIIDALTIHVDGCRRIVPVRVTDFVTSRVESWIRRECAKHAECLVFSDMKGFVDLAPRPLFVHTTSRRRALSTSVCVGLAKTVCRAPCEWFGRKYGCRLEGYHDFRTRSECLARKKYVWERGRCVIAAADAA
jgi:hypothetical protein